MLYTAKNTFFCSYGEPVQGSLYLSIKVKLTKDTSKDNAIEFFTIPGPDDFTVLRTQNLGYIFAVCHVGSR